MELLPTGVPQAQDRPMHAGDWICRCAEVQYRTLVQCPKCMKTNPGVLILDGSIRDDGPPKKKSRWDEDDVNFLVPGMKIRLGPGLTLSNGVAVPTAPLEQQRLVHIPANSKGCLIGRGGEHINKIRRQSGARIQLKHEDHETHATISILGTTQQVEMATQMIQEQLNSAGTRKIVEVPEDCIGETIGKGGCNLQAMSEKTGCKVKFIRATELDPTAPADKQICVIRGPADKIPVAEGLVMAKVIEVQQSHIAKRLKVQDDMREAIARQNAHNAAAAQMGAGPDGGGWSAASGWGAGPKGKGKGPSNASSSIFAMQDPKGGHGDKGGYPGKGAMAKGGKGKGKGKGGYSDMGDYAAMGGYADGGYASSSSELAAYDDWSGYGGGGGGMGGYHDVGAAAAMSSQPGKMSSVPAAFRTRSFQAKQGALTQG